MRRLDSNATSNDSTGDNTVDSNPLYYADYDCFSVGSTRNTSSAACINSTMFGNNTFLHVNSYEGDAGSDFFDIYYSKTRFAVETIMALLSMTLNVFDDSKDQLFQGKTALWRIRLDKGSNHSSTNNV